MRILVVEDERDLNRIICKRLGAAGYSTDACFDGLEALDYLAAAEYDAAVFDVMMPKLDGFAAVRRMRESGDNTPVLFLTARDAVSDRVAGLDLGANDYLIKPFSFDELLARIRALSRRQGDVLLEDIHWADLTLKLSSRTLHCGAKSVSLGFKEFEVLKILLANPNGIVSKEELIVKVWGSDSNAEDNNVEAYISFLRKKFFYLGSRAGIGTVRKVGYHLEENA